MASNNFSEMVEILGDVVKVNRAVTRPYLEKKTGLQIVSKGKDFGEIITQADLSVSDALLNGGVEGVVGFRKRYPGSFSEEQDSPERLNALKLLQLDPLDGTGDFVDTYHTDNVMPPTTLVSKLERSKTNLSFVPVSGLIFDIINEIALICDWNSDELGLYKIIPNGSCVGIGLNLLPFKPWRDRKKKIIRINRRISYPQLTFDGPFMDFLRKSLDCEVHQISTGGAGITGMQVLRGCIEPTKSGAETFANLPPIDICFNAQPDWKTWDIDPLEIFARALFFPPRVTIYGNDISANASNESLKKMHCDEGFVISPYQDMLRKIVDLAREFQKRNPDCPLLTKNYDYKNAIVKMAQGKK